MAKAMISGERVLSYGDLKKRLGMPNAEIARGLGPILNEAAQMCKENNLPDVSAVIVTADSIRAGKPMPSDESFDRNEYWSITGIFKSEVPIYQQKVQAFDWRQVRSLGLDQT